MILKLYGSAEAEPFQNATFSTFVFPLCRYALCSLCAVCSVFPLCSMLCVPFVQYALCSLCAVCSVFPLYSMRRVPFVSLLVIFCFFTPVSSAGRACGRRRCRRGGGRGGSAARRARAG